MTMRYVLFRSAFSYENAPNISHVTNEEQTKTLCGRTGWATSEEDYIPGFGVDCRRCFRALRKIDTKLSDETED